MANDNRQQVILEITTDTTGIEQNIEDVKQLLNSIDGSGDKIFSSDSTRTVKDISSELDKATKKLKELAAAGTTAGKEFDGARQSVVELHSEFTRLNEQSQKFSEVIEGTSLKKMESFAQIAGGGAAGIGAITAGFQLMGVTSEDALKNIEKLNQLMAFAQGIQGVKDMIEGYRNWKETVKAAKEARAALAVTEEVGAVATNAGTLATKGFGLALKSIGIGLIIAALAYLVSNFDSIKASIMKVLPATDGLGKTFDKLKSIVMGVGSAVFEFVIAPFKVVYTLFTDGMDAAVEQYKKSLNVVANYKKGFDQQEQSNYQNHTKELVKNTIDRNKQLIAEGEALGKDMADLKEKNALLDLSQAKDEKEKSEKLSEYRVLQNGEIKKAADEREALAKAAESKRAAAAQQAADKRKAELDNLKKIEDDALKAIAQSTLNDRNKELDERQRKYNEELRLYEKYGKDITNITELYKSDEANINKKYDDIINQALTESVNKSVNEYDKKIEEIKKKYEALFKNASPEQIGQLAGAQQFEMDDVSSEKDLKNNSNKANLDLAKTIRDNAPDDTDTPVAAYNKKAEILAAERKAEEEDYALKLQMAQDNAEAIAQINSEHLDKVATIDKADTDNKKEQAKAQKEIEMSKAEAVDKGATSAASSLETFAQVLGESTAAGKAMAVAAATISAIQGAVNSFTSMSSIPIVGPALGAVAAAASLAAGYANIKKILAVKVPGKSTASSAAPPSMANVSAPIVASAQNTGVSDVRVVNDFGMQSIKAYVVQDDLNRSQQQSDFMNNLSTIGG